MDWLKPKKHKVFVSYHHANDQKYKDDFERLCIDQFDIMISTSVQPDNIEQGLKVETIRQKIRDEYLRESTVTVVLIGSQTWQRKHVDWEIAASIRDTQYNPRSGLLGILLPSNSNYYKDLHNYDPYIIPPRLHDNISCGFASLYKWNNSPYLIQEWIDDSFRKRNRVIPDNSYENYVNNRYGSRWY